MLESERSYTIEEIEQETGFDRRTIAYYVQEGLLPKVGRRGPRTRYPRPYLDRLLFIKKIRDLQDRGQLGNYTLEDIKEIFDTVPERMIADIVSGKEPLEIAPYGGTLSRRPASLGTPRERIERLRRLGERRASRGDLDDGGRGERLSAPANRMTQRPYKVGWPGREPLDEPEATRGAPRTPERRRRVTADEDEATRAPGEPARSSMSPPPAPDADPDDQAALFLDLDAPHQMLEVRKVEESAPSSAVLEDRRAVAEPPPPPRALAALLARLDALAGRHARDGAAERWTRARVTDDIVLSVRGLDEEGAEVLERLARVLRGVLEE